MKIGVVLLNFGEPEHATPEEVVPFLERIFLTNAPLMGNASPEAVRARSRQMAEDRAPGLIEEYEAIGGSPLHAQARAQAQGLAVELGRRGHHATVLLGFQFTRPSIADAVRAAQKAGVEVLVGLPVYPLCGPSTTVAALADMERAVRELGWDVRVREVTGWHRHPAYIRLRADAIRNVLRETGVALEGGTKLVFSAHGTPVKYLREGSRYDVYVRDFCDAVAAELGGVEYALGYQNHSNRPGLEWTQPEIDEVIGTIAAERVVVDAVSFMHEQSETLAELDHGLRERAEARGLGFHRVPIPFDAPAFLEVMADLVEALVPSDTQVASDAVCGVPLAQCRCRPVPGTLCLNAAAVA
jgi:ferrochelatase